MTKAKTQNQVSDESNDHKYFTQIPMLVWAKASDPYDLMLWFAIKSEAWRTGVCMLSTEDLAALSMMSTGKVSECRQRLLDLGLLNGEVKKDAGYPQPVWHLTIPDIWAENIAWARANGDIDDRIAHKKQQRTEADERKAAKKSLHQMKADTPKEPSPHEGGTPPHEGGTPPHEGGTPPHEGGTPPHEPIKIYIDKEDQNQDFSEENQQTIHAIPSRDRAQNGMDGVSLIADLPLTVTENGHTNGDKPHESDSSPNQDARDLPNAAPESSAKAPPLPPAPMPPACREEPEEPAPEEPEAAPLGPLPPRDLALSLIETYLPEWRNPHIHVDSCDPTDLFYLLTWLWMVKQIKDSQKVSTFSREGTYLAKDMADYLERMEGMKRPLAVIITRTGGGSKPMALRAHEQAKLKPTDLADLQAAISPDHDP